jgi:hypothetical protein
MNKFLALLSITLFAAVFSAAAVADDQIVYKWTDSQGTVHYSDKPPAVAAADLQTLDLPPLPPQDPAKIAADQAALAASTRALQQQMLTQAALDQQAAEHAQQRAELQATEAALQQDAAAAAQPAPVYAIYANSPFIPRSFRTNLYGAHRPSDRRSMSVDHPMVSRPSRPPASRP